MGCPSLSSQKTSRPNWTAAAANQPVSLQAGKLYSGYETAERQELPLE
jgi:hypothetical protein